MKDADMKEKGPITPTPYRLWRPELESYPSPHPDDRRLVGANNICVGILFGAIDEVLDAQDFIVLAVNSHEALTKERDELRTKLEAINRRASSQPLRNWDQAIADLDACADLARSALTPKAAP